MFVKIEILHYLSFERIISDYNLVKKFLGDFNEEGTPVPIPNTEVKLFSADDSNRENKSLPRYFFLLF